VKDAKTLLTRMVNLGPAPDKAHTKGGMVGEAHALLREAKKIHRKQSSVTYHTLIHGYCKMEEFFKSVNQLTDADHFSLVTKFIEREFPNAVISFDLNLREALWVFDDQG
jgi:hypothetical protein